MRILRAKGLWMALILGGLVVGAVALRGWRQARRLEDLCRRADALAKLDRLDEAEQLYRRALALRPNHLEALIALERIYATSGRLDASDAMSDAIKRVVPRGWQDHLLLAEWRLSFYDHAHAALHLRKALEQNPGDAMVRQLLAASLVNLGNAEEAKGVLAPLLERNPRDPTAHYLMGSACVDLGDVEQAQRHFAAVVTYGNPDDEEVRDALVRLVQLHLDLHDESGAREWLDHLARVEPRGARVRWARGLVEASRHNGPSPLSSQSQTGASQQHAPLRFRAAASDVGIDFRHHSPFSDRRLTPETFGGGVAVFDYDGDGAMDLYFVNGGTTTTAGPEPGPPNRLYRNLGGATFEDVTEASGAGLRGFGHGVIAADYDNDGDTDLYLTNYGPNALLENLGDGTFRDVTVAAGVGDARLSCGAAFLDIDGDGDLDLYVANYCKLNPAMRPCPGDERQIIFCPPPLLEPENDVLYRNNGDGTFTDVTGAAGVLRSGWDAGRGFCVLAADLDLDGHTDLYVANDQSPNFLFLGRGDGTFDDRTAISGADVNIDGTPEGSMGIACGDLDGDGPPELCVTNYWLQTNTLYHNAGAGFFRDVTARLLGNSAGRRAVGWGTALVDFDNDTALDLIVANGHVDNNVTGQPFLQPAQVWRGHGTEPFVEETASLGGYFAEPHAGRALAVGDLNNDGRNDVVISHLNDSPVVLFNETEPTGHWLRLRLIGTAANRDAVGARVEVHVGNRALYHQRTSGGGYLSSSDPRILIGLGETEKVDSVVVHWPDGTSSLLENLEADREYAVEQPVLNKG